MEIKSLKHTNNNNLFEAFEDAFRDYEMQLRKSELLSMLKRRGFNPELSFGAFYNEKLVAFTFNGIGEYNGAHTAYDTGTGTTKAYRGKGLAQKIFSYSIPFLKQAGVHQYLLEVLQHNEEAVHLYTKMGFKTVGEFNYYVMEQNAIEFKNRELPNEYQLRQNADLSNLNTNDFWDFQPSWQNTFGSVKRSAEDFMFFGVYKKDELLGYSILDPNSGDLTQLAVKKSFRRKGIGSYLFQKTLEHNQQDEAKVININSDCGSLIGFMASHNIQETGKQFEMIKKF